MSKTIYVAASSRELDLAERCMAELRKHGYKITFDWVANIREVGVPDHELTPDELREHAYADLEGVEDADIFWMLSPETPSVGAYVELGYALHGMLMGSKRKIIVSGRASLFTSLAHESYASHEEALATLCLGRPRVDLSGKAAE